MPVQISMVFLGEKMERWKKCVEFHGHECGGLAIGYKAALYAEKLLNITHSADEQVVCISENDACGVDGIQVMLGCSVGKGNLLFHMTGKQAFNIYHRKTGESVRLVLKPKPRQMTKAESFAYYQETELEDLFFVKETTLKLPEEARIFQSVVCDGCGEIAAENYIHLENGKNLCRDCYKCYSRFDI